MTPFTLSKTACVPQKQPPAKTAVCLLGFDASERSTFAGGIGVFGAGAAFVVQAERNIAHPRTTPPSKRVTINTSTLLFYETRFSASGYIFAVEIRSSSRCLSSN